MKLYIHTEINYNTGDITGNIDDQGIKATVTTYHPDDVLEQLNTKVLGIIKKAQTKGLFKKLKPSDIEYYSAITGLKLNLKQS